MLAVEYTSNKNQFLPISYEKIPTNFVGASLEQERIKSVLTSFPFLIGTKKNEGISQLFCL